MYERQLACTVAAPCIRSIFLAIYVHRGIAQLVEQRSPKPRAEGSSPSAPAIRWHSSVGRARPW